MNKPIIERENEWKNLLNYCKDENGQAHFPTTKLNRGQIDRVKLGRIGGYYPKMGEKK